MTDNNSSSVPPPSNPSRRGAVADYYAILGVGDTFQLIQKQQQISSSSQNYSYNNHPENESEKKNDDDENSPLFRHHQEEEMERFAREIIAVKIVMVMETAPTHEAEDDGCSLDSPSFEKGSVIWAQKETLQTNMNDDDEDHWNRIEMTLPCKTSGLAMPASDDDDDTTSEQQQQHVLWNRHEQWKANLEIRYGLRGNIWARQQQKAIEATGLIVATSEQGNPRPNSPLSVSAQPMFQMGFRKTVEQKLFHKASQWNPLKKQPTTTQQEGATQTATRKQPPPQFYVAYQKRHEKQDWNTPAIADIQIGYIRIHKSLVPKQNPYHRFEEEGNDDEPWLSDRFSIDHHRRIRSVLSSSSSSQQTETDDKRVSLADLVAVPNSFDEIVIPEPFQYVLDPNYIQQNHRTQKHSADDNCTSISQSHSQGSRQTILLARTASDYSTSSSPTQQEAIETVIPPPPEEEEELEMNNDNERSSNRLIPRLLGEYIEHSFLWEENEHCSYCYIPVLLVRRQQITDEERFHEDAAIVDMAVSFYDRDGSAVLPDEDHLLLIDDRSEDKYEEDEDEIDDDGTFHMLGKTKWSCFPLQLGTIATSRMQAVPSQTAMPSKRILRQRFGMPALLVRKNLPSGFADVAFATRVLGRFPLRNYKGLPLPEEELPMFCYPTGCRLHRAEFSNAPLPQYYGFVVKNERGDSIYVSCVSFMEPLTSDKMEQLARMSYRRRKTSLPHRRYCENQERRKCTSQQRNKHGNPSSVAGNVPTTEADSSILLMAFDDMTTFENKTICIISRYPFWTAFRKFLSHLHIISGSMSELPLERWISHLLLSVLLPKPGASVLVPLPALNEPMILSLPPEKDFPLVDLPYHRLFACLDCKTIVSIVVGLLALEKKLIIMSTRPSLVLDVCELLRSLLFPFELCAPYVPRLTEPFKSSLDFPGAIFVGIHDDGSPAGLAAMVKRSFPEDSFILDLDTGEMDCDGQDPGKISAAWEIIPENSRANLVSELETLCRDAMIVDGQEPLDSCTDSAFFLHLPDAVEGFGVNTDAREPLDDRAVRDAFLRFFCSILGGYERFLVVPDADFLVSGDDWFDARGFLSSVPKAHVPYLSCLVSTQLFQSFIQRRTEASDVHCMLFDECLTEYHSASIPYGRLGGDVEAISVDEIAQRQQPQILFSLLIDQSATMQPPVYPPTIPTCRSVDVSDADSSFSLNLSKASASVADYSNRHSEVMTINSGDIVTAPTKQDLPSGRTYIYFRDGKPCFPHKINLELCLPREPSSWEVEMTKNLTPLLARSERELEEANRRRKMAVSHRGLQKQRRCLWQLPKLMGSHFLGSWLLCVPALVSQPYLTNDQQSRFLQRALGALRLLRSKQRIVPDEAAYRALMVACGRSRSDRRVELVKLFGLLRSDGIFPSAVTLGQYTKALAEGYSKRSSGTIQDEEYGGVEVTASGRKFGVFNSTNASSNRDFATLLRRLDKSLEILESQGKRWRQRQSKDDNNEMKKALSTKSWLPVVLSSSFIPTSSARRIENQNIRFVCMWSRTRNCTNCGYVPLEEEIQAGWDIADGENNFGAVPCPRCESLVVPMLGYKDLSIEEATHVDIEYLGEPSSGFADFSMLPPQISPTVETASSEDGISFVTYIDPSTLRVALERYIEEYGEDVLDRERLKQLDPEVFYNLWWYCARFSLPLPLPCSPDEDHYCALAAWDRASAERGCYSAAKVITEWVCNRQPIRDDNVSNHSDIAYNDVFDTCPLLSRFNLQGFYSSVWDHPDLSKLLVALVEACDKRDFKAVVECIVQCNTRRREEFGNGRDSTSSSRSSVAGSFSPSVELDAYRTILYLAKYQCTTAFHSFFPSTIKPCKGYHFWCALGTPLPIFDRLLRDAIHRVHHSKDKNIVGPIPEVSDVALGFRCVFGHLI